MWVSRPKVLEQFVRILGCRSFWLWHIHLENQAVHNQAVVVVQDLRRLVDQAPGPFGKLLALHEQHVPYTNLGP